HSEKCQQPIVAGLITCDKAFASAHVGKRVDAEGGVIDRDRAPEKPYHQHGPSADQEAKNAECDGGNELVLVEPHQLRITGKIGDIHEIGAVMAAGKNPSQMAVDKSLVAGRMHVTCGIGV